MFGKVYAALGKTNPINVERPTEQIRITDVGQLVGAAVGALLIISALLAFFFLIMGGIQWITSGGDKTGMEAARNKITHAIVGLIIVGAAWAIMMLIQSFLGITIIGTGNTQVQLPTPFSQ